TNVLLRALHRTLPLHLECRQLIAQVRADGYTPWVSRQVIREYLVQVTRPGGMLIEPLAGEQAERQVHLIERMFVVADETKSVTDHLMELIRDYPTGGKQIHDANIVATMLAFDIDTLLTLNEADLKRFAGIIMLRTLTASEDL
ncbi:MAG: PIN domain-containing protein, partial [Afipia sp.]|nr:PIN domain-containing protein [Afipia sp.]